MQRLTDKDVQPREDNTEDEVDTALPSSPSLGSSGSLQPWSPSPAPIEQHQAPLVHLLTAQ